jgi:dTMP kinase
LAMFITFEGCEGCGKTYQTRALYNYLTTLEIPVICTNDPGGTTLGKELERLMKQRYHDYISAEVELFLFNVCRLHLVNEVIRPSLQKGNVVICDRFVDSTRAYQGYGRGIEMATIETLHNIATGGISPEFTILLDIPVEEGLRRKHTQGRDRFEEEDLSFHNRVRDGYLKMSAEEPDRWMVIDATMPRVDISRIINVKIEYLLECRQGE